METNFCREGWTVELDLAWDPIDLSKILEFHILYILFIDYII